MKEMPASFSREFLLWIREATQASWFRMTSPIDGWMPGTIWSPFSDSEIEQAENRFGMSFPSDYRQLLSILGRTTPGQLVSSSDDEDAVWDGFIDWRQPDAALAKTLEIADGIWWDVEIDVETTSDVFEAIKQRKNVLRSPSFWKKEWGACPASSDDRRARIKELVSAAPPLIPLIGNRYLVATAEQGNSVLSIHQCEVLLWANGLRDFLLHDLAQFLPALDVDPPTKQQKLGFWDTLVVERM